MTDTTEQIQEQTPTPELSYFQKRCAAIGLTPERNVLKVQKSKHVPGPKQYDEFPLMTEDEKTGDILIPVYNLKGEPATYLKDNPGKLDNRKAKFFEIRRYHPDRYAEMCKKAEDEGKDAPGKYNTPYKAKTLPWISPNIIEAHEDGSEIDTIVIIEGYIKAISGYLNGLYIIGLSGIQNYKDKDTTTLHPDIITIIKEQKVNNIIILYDGDCANISLKALEAGKDLYERPAGFFYSARGINEMLKDHRRQRHFDLYFAHVNTCEEITAKGLDDLYEEFPDKCDRITNELISFSKLKNFYFKRFNITAGLTKVLNHLHINSAEVFYTAHSTHINEKPFIFHGTKYQFDQEKKELKVIVPGAARNYFRAGNDYYEKVFIPNKYGILEYRYDRRAKGVITDDHGKHIIKHIPKYKAFCTKPDHVNYQEIINNCFNRYRPFEHQASEDTSCPETIEFLKHIFGTRDITYKNKDGIDATVNELDLGLDYLQLLYQRPTQILPILCLVSKENNTGKSTFGKLLKAIFTGNMAIIGNSDLENDFNAGWADKLIICCEESMIDKKKVAEKIKALSTGDKIQINQKGVDQVEIDFFGKFLLMSNNEENFVIANEHDERYWVRKVPKAQKERTNLLKLMIEEIPNFLAYLNKRSLATTEESRMHFAPVLLRTEALKRLVDGNKSGIQKEFTSVMASLFSDTGFWKIELTAKLIGEDILKKRFDQSFILKTLTDKMGFSASKKTQRYTYPKMERWVNEKKQFETKIIIHTDIGKPFSFTADQFLQAEDIENFVLSADALFHGQADFAPKEVVERSNGAQTTLALDEPNEKIEEKSSAIHAARDNDDLPY